MRTVPRDVEDLMLAPVALQVEDRLLELGALGVEELPDRLALDSDRPGWDTERRIAQVLASVRRDLELHGWDLSWDPRGIRLSHGVHALVLGLPASLVRYVDGSR